MRWASSILVLGGLLLASIPADAQNPRIRFDLMVSHVSPKPGPIDPAGRELDRRLRDQLRYESLEVLQQEKLRLALDEIGTVRLPTGRSLRLRPLDLGEAGVLVAVDLEGSTQMDLRVPNGKLVIIGGQPYEDGKLVITLQPAY